MRFQAIPEEESQWHIPQPVDDSCEADLDIEALPFRTSGSSNPQYGGEEALLEMIFKMSDKANLLDIMKV